MTCVMSCSACRLQTQGAHVCLVCLQVFVLGGSWSGPKDLAKDAEVWDPATGTWTLLPGIQAASILTNDPEGTYRSDNYGWFFGWTAGSGTCRPLFSHVQVKRIVSGR